MQAPRTQRDSICRKSGFATNSRRFRTSAVDTPPHPARLRPTFNNPSRLTPLRYAIGAVAIITLSLSSLTDSPAFNVQAQIHAGDRAALEAIYDATDGDNWATNTNWKSNAPLDQWYGVTADDDGRVDTLILARNNLVGTLPAAIGGLENLVDLRLGYNSLTGPLPSEIGNLKKLNVLFLYFNDLEGNIPQRIWGLRALTWVNLSHNNLTGSLPENIDILRSLRSLNLTGNQLEKTIPPRIGKLINLERLTLGLNSLEGPIPSELGDLQNLEVLQLNSNSLEGPIPSELGGLQNLEVLYLHDNSLTGPIPTELQSLTGLNEAPGQYGIRGSLWDNPGLCVPAAIQQWLTDLPVEPADRNDLHSDIPLCDELKSTLAQRFAPVLRMHDEEIVYPRAVGVMIDEAVLKDGSGNDISGQPNPLTADYLSDFDRSSHRNHYLDLERVTPPYWYGETKTAEMHGPGAVEIYGSYNLAERRISQDQYELTVYADTYVDNNRLYLIYSMFYPLDRNHEGDWETVILQFDGPPENNAEILLSRIINNEIEPAGSTYLAHGIPDSRCWAQTPVQGKNPEVFVARGSHASHFSDAIRLIDETSDAGDVLVPSGFTGEISWDFEYGLAVLDPLTHPWVNFLGKWGEQLDRKHGNGPHRPDPEATVKNILKVATVTCLGLNSLSISPGQYNIGQRIVNVKQANDVPGGVQLQFSWPAIDKIANGEGELDVDVSRLASDSDAPGVPLLSSVLEEFGEELLELIDISLSESLRGRETTVCIPTPFGFPGDRTILHFDESTGQWERLETFNGDQEHVSCAVTDSFSLFAVVGERAVGFAGSRIAPSKLASHIQPNVTSITLSPSDSVRLSTNIFGQQDILDNSLAENLTFEWDLDGTTIEGDGHEIEFTLPESPGRYTVTATLPDTECNAKHGTCSAEFNIRVRRPRSIDPAVDVSEPVNPAGQIPIVIPGADGTQHAVFTPVEGGSVKSRSCTFEAPSGAINDNEFIGIAVQTTDDPTQLTPVDDPRFVTQDSQCNLSAVDNAGTNIADYRLRVAGDVCIPVPDEYRSNTFDIRLLSVDNGQTQILATRVIINDPQFPLKLCGKLSTLPNTVFAALPANLAPKIPTPVTDSGEITTPDTGPSAIPPMATWFILVLGIALLVFVTTVKLKNHNFRRSRR